MSKATADPATFTREAQNVTVMVESGSTDATVSIGVSDSAGGIVYREVGTILTANSGVDAVIIGEDVAGGYIKVAGHGAGKYVICTGGVPV